MKDILFDLIIMLSFNEHGTYIPLKKRMTEKLEIENISINDF